MIERTREVGLLRAVGMSRRQLRSMIRLESVAISVLGAVLGIGLGLIFGISLQRAISGPGHQVLSVPVGPAADLRGAGRARRRAGRGLARPARGPDGRTARDHYSIGVSDIQSRQGNARQIQRSPPKGISTMIRIVVAALFALHGVIHFLGFAEAFGVTDLPQFDASIPPAIGLLWLVGGLLCLATAAALFLTPRWWWAFGAGAVVISQAAIVTSWMMRSVGTAANLLLFFAVALRLRIPRPVEPALRIRA